MTGAARAVVAGSGRRARPRLSSPPRSACRRPCRRAGRPDEGAARPRPAWWCVRCARIPRCPAWRQSPPSGTARRARCGASGSPGTSGTARAAARTGRPDSRRAAAGRAAAAPAAGRRRGGLAAAGPCAAGTGRPGGRGPPGRAARAGRWPRRAVPFPAEAGRCRRSPWCLRGRGGAVSSTCARRTAVAAAAAGTARVGLGGRVGRAGAGPAVRTARSGRSAASHPSGHAPAPRLRAVTGARQGRRRLELHRRQPGPGRVRRVLVLQLGGHARRHHRPGSGASSR